MRGEMLYTTNSYKSGIFVQLLDNFFLSFWFLFFSFISLGLLNSFSVVFLCLFEIYSLSFWYVKHHENIFHKICLVCTYRRIHRQPENLARPEFHCIRCSKTDRRICGSLWGASRRQSPCWEVSPEWLRDWVPAAPALYFSPLVYTSTLSWWGGQGTSF